MILDQNKVYLENTEKVQKLAVELLEKIKNETALVNDFYDFKAVVEKIFEVCFLGDEKLKFVSIVSSSIAVDTENIKFFTKSHTKEECQSLFKRLLKITNL